MLLGEETLLMAERELATLALLLVLFLLIVLQSSSTALEKN
jgi:hypothetical protein